MTVTELLAAVRTLYVDVLSDAAKDEGFLVEPTYRLSDGSVAMEGTPPLPCRVDLIPTKGDAAGNSLTVDSTTQLQFESIAFQLASTSASISPFTWDWAPLRIQGLALDVVTPILAAWFLEWFDPDDRNAETEEGLHNVVHFMSNPKQDLGGIRVDIDLGSASGQALEELLFRLSDAGALEVHVG